MISTQIAMPSPPGHTLAHTYICLMWSFRRLCEAHVQHKGIKKWCIKKQFLMHSKVVEQAGSTRTKDTAHNTSQPVLDAQQSS